MLNKIVKVSDYNLILYFFPNLKVREELTFLDKSEDVLYIGSFKPQLGKYLADRTKSYISVVGNAEIDLTDNEKLVDFTAEVAGVKVTNKLREDIKNMDLKDVEEMCKICAVSHRWPRSIEDCEVTDFDLFEASTTSSIETLRTYFKLREYKAYPLIESSFLTFLSKVANINDISVSPKYMAVIKKANARWGSKVRKLVVELGKDDDELAFINLLCSLN